MSGRAIYDPTSGRCLWSAASVSPGRALYNNLPAVPPSIYVKWQPGLPYLHWIDTTGQFYNGLDWQNNIGQLGANWRGFWTPSGYYGSIDYTFEKTGNGTPWGVFGYYTATAACYGLSLPTGLARVVSSVLLLTTSSYSNALPSGGSISFTLRIEAAGLKSIRVDSITYPSGFTGATWAGVLAPGEYHEETVTASVAAYPPAVTYGGEIVVSSNVDTFPIWVSLTNHEGGCD